MPTKAEPIFIGALLVHNVSMFNLSIIDKLNVTGELNTVDALIQKASDPFADGTPTIKKREATQTRNTCIATHDELSV
jgi:hypothetical protein